MITEYERLLDNPVVRESYTLPNALEIAQLDTKWVDEITNKNMSEKVRLEVELKTYMNNMIKESIRVSYMRKLRCWSVISYCDEDGSQGSGRVLSFNWRVSACA